MGNTDYIFDIDVDTCFLDDQSAPEEGRFVFAYTIHIRNGGKIPARLLRRHWLITDGNNEVQEVRGLGVVGKQPLLQPGESFEYTSGSSLTTPIGTMKGTYQMVGEDGTRFDAEIPEFVLAAPGMLH